MDAYKDRSNSQSVQGDLHEPFPRSKCEADRLESPSVGGDTYTCIERDYCGIDCECSQGKVNKNENEENKENRKEESSGDLTKVNLIALPCKCKSQWCPDCRMGHAVKWRERLRPHIKVWERVSMITLTIDPKQFDGPEDAYQEIQGKRAVSELIRKMERDGLIEDRRFFYAIEFHKNGWTHWHIAVIPKEKYHGKLNAGGYLFKAWGFGAVHESVNRLSSPEHAMNYLTKYIVKQDIEAPQWVLNMKGNFRKFSTSRGLCGGIVSRSIPKGGTRKTRSILERMEACKKATVFLKQVIQFRGDKKTVNYSFVGGVDKPVEMVEEHPEWINAKKEWLVKGHLRDSWINHPYSMWRDSVDEWNSTGQDFRQYVSDLADSRYAQYGETNSGHS